MTPDDLADRLRAALLGWGLAVPEGQPEMRPLVDDPGWWVSPVALRVASDGGTAPTGLAERLVQVLAAEGVEATVSGPGFVEVCLGLDLPGRDWCRASFPPDLGQAGPRALTPPARWVAAAAQPRILRSPQNPLLLVQLAHARLVRRVPRAEDIDAAVGRPKPPSGPDEGAGQDAVRRRWVVVRTAWQLPRLAAAAERTDDPGPLAALLEEAAGVGLDADDLPDDEAAALLDVLREGLAVLRTAAPVRV